MATSGSISTTTFQTIKVIDSAFRRCRVTPATVSSEMLSNAKDALYLWLSELANPKPPSWCIERQVYPLYEGQPVVTLEAGTVDVLNVNLRTLQELTGSVASNTLSYTVALGAGTVNTVGLKWSGTSVPVTFQTSSDNATWATVGSSASGVSAGAWTWTDIAQASDSAYFRVVSNSELLLSEVFLGTLPQEIPVGQLNRDTFVAQSNKVFKGRPLTYYFQRQHPLPVLNMWPSPNAEAEHQQLIVWRHRHIMDIGSLSQEVEMPQRWMEAMVAGLASKLAIETPSVDMNLVPVLDARAAIALQSARDGDNDGSSTFMTPNIRAYTR